MTDCETPSQQATEPRPKWGRTKRYARTIGITVAFCVCVLGGLASYFRISSFSDLRAYGGMAAECHPIWQELAFRRIQPGDDFGPTRRTMPPDSQEHLGEYAFFDYGVGFTSLRVYTKDDKVVAAGAGSCTWDYAFFDTLPPEDWTEMNERYTLVLDDRYRHENANTDDATDDQLTRSDESG